MKENSKINLHPAKKLERNFAFLLKSSKQVSQLEKNLIDFLHEFVQKIKLNFACFLKNDHASISR